MEITNANMFWICCSKYELDVIIASLVFYRVVVEDDSKKLDEVELLIEKIKYFMEHDK